jgi:glucan 1,3-beta-glucosidase
MKVWVDLHGLPGSQNGWDHSGRAGPVEWQTQENLRRSIKVVEAVALKYGAQQYADTVVGIQLVNEPISWGANKFETTKKFATDAYHVVRKAAKNKRLMVIMHDAFMSASAWKHTANTLQSKGLFGVDTHLYQCFTGYENMNQEQHIQAACKWGSGLRDANAVLPTFVGEWSPVTNVCLKADGSTFPGKSCSEKGCQCTSTATSTWSRDLVEQVRRYVEAQLDTFEKNSSGYFMWSYKGSVGAWSLREGINHGFIPSPVTSRRYPRQCS